MKDSTAGASMKRRFDWITDRKTPRPGTLWDVELFGNTDFAVVPSLGSIVPGWLLIIPRVPALNFCELGQKGRASLNSLLKTVRERISLPNHELFQFEHGSRFRGSSMGCGVDQAHLHVVPLKFNLLHAVLKNRTENISWSDFNSSADPWQWVPPEKEYILIQGREKTLVATIKKPVSQWVRRIIANECGRAHAWDYKASLGIENILSTRSMVGM
jgi:ATP adenylyltransferase